MILCAPLQSRSPWFLLTPTRRKKEQDMKHHRARRMIKTNSRSIPVIYRLLVVAAAVTVVSAVATIAVFASLSFVLKWGTSGGGDGQFLTPTGITVDSAGNVYVAEGNGNRFQKFDNNGNFLLKAGIP